MSSNEATTFQHGYRYRCRRFDLRASLASSYLCQLSPAHDIRSQYLTIRHPPGSKHTILSVILHYIPSVPPGPRHMHFVTSFHQHRLCSSKHHHRTSSPHIVSGRRQARACFPFYLYSSAFCKYRYSVHWLGFSYRFRFGSRIYSVCINIIICRVADNKTHRSCILLNGQLPLSFNCLFTILVCPG